MSAIEQHIKNTFGEFENVFHELVSPDIHVDICVVPPSEERDYYTLVTMGMVLTDECAGGIGGIQAGASRAGHRSAVGLETG